MQAFYGIFMLMESTYGNNTNHLRKHFVHVKATYGGVPKLGWDRFSALLSALQPSNKELQRVCFELQKAFVSHLEPNTVSNLFI